VGDTTTTMMWIDGVTPLEVVHAYAAALPALAVCGLVAAFQQQRHAPVAKDAVHAQPIDWPRIGIVLFTLLAAIAANVVANLYFPAVPERFPVVGTAAFLAIVVASPVRRPAWQLLPGAFKNSVFLLALVVSASLMPVEQLPPPSWHTAFGLGAVSAVFDNIPLTALALAQGHYDWGMLAYAVGYGGSMIWFGSSAGVALAHSYPEAKSVARWLKHGWHVALSYVVGFFVLLALLGWQPIDHEAPARETTVAER
jgi:hypothetical protein